MSKSKLQAQASGRLVEIELPLEGTRTKVQINPTTTAQQILDTIVQRPFYKNSSYAFSLAPSNNRKRILSPSQELIKINSVCIKAKDYFSSFCDVYFIHSG